MSGTINDFPFSSDLLDCKTSQNDPWTDVLSVDFVQTSAIIKTLTLKMEGSVSAFHIELQEGGGFVALSDEFPGAIGQGETIKEAMADIQSAISLLKEVLDEDKQSSQNNK